MSLATLCDGYILNLSLIQLFVSSLEKAKQANDLSFVDLSVMFALASNPGSPLLPITLDFIKKVG